MNVSKLKTTLTTALVDWHFAKLKFNRPKWDNDRVHRLCRKMRCTPYELASLCRITGGLMQRMMRKNHYPEHVVMLFWMYEIIYKMAAVDGKPTVVSPLHLLPHPPIKTPIDEFLAQRNAVA